MINWRSSNEKPPKPKNATRLIDRTPPVATQPKAQEPTPPTDIIKKIITVASAKGGVGKSTVAVNLAVAMAKVGLKVGLLDVDVYGPSCHVLLGTEDAKPEALSNGKLTPILAHGVQSFSIAYVSDPDKPMLWRGSIVSRAIQKMFEETAWATPENPLDILIIDTPPGTGEAHLTLAQSLPIDAAILVTTPSNLATVDVIRGAAMYDRLEIPILGIVQTMSYLELPTGRIYPFGKAGANTIAEKIGVPLLADIPISEAINTANTCGVPVALDGNSNVFMEIGHKVATRLDALTAQPLPEITFVD